MDSLVCQDVSGGGDRLCLNHQDSRGDQHCSWGIPEQLERERLERCGDAGGDAAEYGSGGDGEGSGTTSDNR